MSNLAIRAKDFAYWRAKRVRNRLRRRTIELSGLWKGNQLNKQDEESGPVGVDVRVRYPSFRSLDEFIDVEHLRSLDAFVNARVRDEVARGGGEPFQTGAFKRGLWSAVNPGPLSIPLSLSLVDKSDYLALSDPDKWRLSETASVFQPLLEFIETLPFERTARMLIVADPRGRHVTPHRDHNQTGVCHEFVWFRTNLTKPLWVQDLKSEHQKHYVDSYSAWFDTVNQYHGVDATGELAVSIRVDGIFTEEFRAQIPRADSNPSSRASLWSSVGSISNSTSPAGCRQ